MTLIKTFILGSFILLSGCAENKNKPEEKHGDQEVKKQTNPSQLPAEVMLTDSQFNALEMKVDTLTSRLLNTIIEVNGHLEVPPQSEATVSPVIGGNINAIKVIEGDEVKRGTVLAYLSHPEIIQVQTDYINTRNQLKFLEKDFARQEKLYKAGVGSGETFQKAEAELESARGHLKGMQAQLKQLHINPQKLDNGEIQQQIPVISPIDGAIQAVNIKTGQFVQEQYNMFEIINTHHVHVDLRVFEKDVSKVSKGQQVHFTIASQPEQEWTATILSIGKNFEQEPKALHVHAEIDERTKNLIAGMYVNAKIIVDKHRNTAIPEAAIAKNGDKSYIFTVEKEGEGWSFKPVEVTTGSKDEEWVALTLKENISPETLFAQNNAYYLMGEMNKDEGGGHQH